MNTQQAIKLFGSKAKVARALKISRQAISKWGDKVPPLRVYQIKEIREKARKKKQ